MPTDKFVSPSPAKPKALKALKLELRAVRARLKTGETGSIAAESVEAIAADLLAGANASMEAIPKDPSSAHAYCREWAGLLSQVKSKPNLCAGLAGTAGGVIEQLLECQQDHGFTLRNHELAAAILRTAAPTGLARKIPARVFSAALANMETYASFASEQTSSDIAGPAPKSVLWLVKEFRDVAECLPAWKTGLRLSEQQQHRETAEKRRQKEREFDLVEAASGFVTPTPGEPIVQPVPEWKAELIQRQLDGLRKQGGDRILPSRTHHLAKKTVPSKMACVSTPSGQDVNYKGPIYGAKGVAARIETYLKASNDGLRDAVGLARAVARFPNLTAGVSRYHSKITRKLLRAVVRNKRNPSVAGALVDYTLLVGGRGLAKAGVSPKKMQRAVSAMPLDTAKAFGSVFAGSPQMKRAIERGAGEARVKHTHDQARKALKNHGHKAAIHVLEQEKDTSLRRKAIDRKLLTGIVDAIYLDAACDPAALSSLARLVPIAGGKMKMADLTPERLRRFAGYMPQNNAGRSVLGRLDVALGGSERLARFTGAVTEPVKSSAPASITIIKRPDADDSSLKSIGHFRRPDVGQWKHGLTNRG